MATLPAYNPEIPYLGLIPGGVRAGTMIRVKGSMNYGGHRFMISLQTGAALRPRDDTAFQLSVRPAEQVIVRNHYENNVWGTEERFGGCPINPNPGQPFEILILVETTGYKISINGNHFCHFHHRFSMYKVTFIAVESDITVTSITMGTDIPSAPPAPPPMPVPIQPYPPHITYPGHGHRPQYPHYPHYPGHGHPPGHVYPGPPQIPGYVPGPPPPPPYSPTPYPGHRYPYVHPRVPTATPPSNYSWQNDPNYLRRRNKNNAIKYAAVAAGVGGVGLGAFALSRAMGSGGNDGVDDVEDGGGDDGGFE